MSAIFRNGSNAGTENDNSFSAKTVFAHSFEPIDIISQVLPFSSMILSCGKCLYFFNKDKIRLFLKSDIFSSLDYLFNEVSSFPCFLVNKYWFGLALWHINHFRLFNAKSFLYIYIKYIGFGLVWFGLVLCHINQFKLF